MEAKRRRNSHYICILCSNNPALVFLRKLDVIQYAFSELLTYRKKGMLYFDLQRFVLHEYTELRIK